MLGWAFWVNFLGGLFFQCLGSFCVTNVTSQCLGSFLALLRSWVRVTKRLGYLLRGFCVIFWREVLSAIELKHFFCKYRFVYILLIKSFLCCISLNCMQSNILGALCESLNQWFSTRGPHAARRDSKCGPPCWTLQSMCWTQLQNNFFLQFYNSF